VVALLASSEFHAPAVAPNGLIIFLGGVSIACLLQGLEGIGQRDAWRPLSWVA